jgi:hypothetical protein
MLLAPASTLPCRLATCTWDLAIFMVVVARGGGAVVFFQWNSVRYTKNPCAMQNATDSIQ